MRNPANIRYSRAMMVQKYIARPATWPDGIEDKRWPWYTTHKVYWDAMAKKVDDRGRWLDPFDDPMVHPHLHPAGYPEDGVPRRLDGATKTATKTPATKTIDATKTPFATKTANSVTEVVKAIEKRKGGRPKTAKALSSTERSRKARVKKAGGIQFKG